jgi:outer membrane usher protein
MLKWCFPSQRSFLFFISLFLGFYTSIAYASSIGLSFPSQASSYFLKVAINGIDQGVIVPFTRMPNGAFALKRGDLEALDLKVPPDVHGDLIILRDISGVATLYNEAQQSIDLLFPDSLRVTQVLKGSYRKDPVPITPSATGALLNYTLFGMKNTSFFYGGSVGVPLNAPNLSLSGDLNIFSPLGHLSNTFVSNMVGPIHGIKRFTRLNTTATYRNAEDLYTVHGGDFVSGGLWWTYPVRLGGIQIQRDFSLQPNFITMPLPAFSGSAALPSTVDIYNQNIKIFSSDVKPGPFLIPNIPQLSKSSSVQVVMRDTLGREVTTSIPFYTSSKLLVPGLTSYSLDVGYPRYLFGTDSFNYGNKIVASGSLRHGLTNRLTLEIHGEGGDGLINGGFGSALHAGPLGIFSLAGGGSLFRNEGGTYIAGAYEWSQPYFSIFLTSRRNFGFYNDIGSISDRHFIMNDSPSMTGFWKNWVAQNRSQLRGSDQVTLSVPFPAFASALSIAMTRAQYTDSTASNFLNFSMSTALLRGNLSVSGFWDLERKNKGIYATYSLTLGEHLWGSVNATGSSNVSGYGFDLLKNKGPEDSWSWRITDREGPSPYRMVRADVDTHFGHISGSVQNSGRNTNVSGQVSGSLVFMDSGLLIGAPINGSFGVVDVGSPGVVVKQNNHVVGKTNSGGRILVPNLSSYFSNKIEVDPITLPPDRVIEKTEMFVLPPPQTGIRLSFSDSALEQGALVQFVDPQNVPLPLSSYGRIEGQGEDFIIGHDGEAYILGLKEPTLVRIHTPKNVCLANIPTLALLERTRIPIGPVICSPE